MNNGPPIHLVTTAWTPSLPLLSSTVPFSSRWSLTERSSPICRSLRPTAISRPCLLEVPYAVWDPPSSCARWIWLCWRKRLVLVLKSHTTRSWRPSSRLSRRTARLSFPRDTASPSSSSCMSLIPNASDVPSYVFKEGRIRWADGKLIKEELDKQILELLGPETEEDKAVCFSLPSRRF